MLPPDVPIWKAWRKDHEAEFLGFYYNCNLSVIDVPKTYADPKMIEMWMKNVSKRIDAIGLLKDKVLIVEVTGTANLRAIGQATGYRLLWEKIRPLPLPAEAAILCNFMDDDISFICGRCEIIPIVIK
jgi:hypothetical protein